jgi:hypothetical protein
MSDLILNDSDTALVFDGEANVTLNPSGFLGFGRQIAATTNATILVVGHLWFETGEATAVTNCPFEGNQVSYNAIYDAKGNWHAAVEATPR